MFFCFSDPNSPFFTLEVHHKGILDNGDGDFVLVYTGGQVSYFDYCNISFMSKHGIDNMIEELGYTVDEVVCYMSLAPNDWRIIENESNVEELLQTINNYRVVIYVAPVLHPQSKNSSTHDEPKNDTPTSETEYESDEPISECMLNDSDYEQDDLDFLKFVDENIEWGGLDKEIDSSDDGDSDYVEESEISDSDLDVSDSSEGGVLQ